MPRIISRIIDQDDFFGVPSSGQVIIYDNVGSGILGFKTGNVVTSVSGTGTVSGLTLTGTVTNSGSLTLGGTLSAISLVSGVTGTLPIAKGGTNLTALGTANQVLAVNAGATALAYVTPTSGTVTSVSGAGTVSGLTLTGNVTSSGSLTLGGTLAAIALASGVSGILPVANGGTGVTTSTGTTNVVLSNSPTLVTPLSNSLSAVPVASGAGNSLTIAAGSGVTSGAGGSLILQAGLQAATGGDGKVIVKQVAGQTSNLQEWQKSTGAMVAAVTHAGDFSSYKNAVSNGYLAMGSGSSGAMIPLIGGQSEHSTYGFWFYASRAANIGNISGFANQFIFESDFTATTGNLITVNNNTVQRWFVTASGTVVSRGVSGQTANLQEWQDSAGTVLGAVTAAGRLGIGTASPNQLLHVRRGSSGVGMASNGTATFEHSSEVYLDILTPANGAGGIRFNLGSDTRSGIICKGPSFGAGEKLEFIVAGAESLVILANQNIGMGAATPVAALHVVSRASGTKSLIVQGAASQTANLQEWQNSAGTVLASVSAAGSLEIYSATTADLLKLTVGANANAGILFQGGGASASLAAIRAIDASGYNGDLAFYTDNNGASTSSLTERMRILSAGNVGIGTTSPSARTHIVTAAATKGLIVQGAASQTANLQEWQNSAGTVLASVDAAGKVISNALAAIPVTSGAGNSLTIAAGSGVTSGAGGSLILQAGLQATSGGDGKINFNVGSLIVGSIESFSTTGGKLTLGDGFFTKANGQNFSFNSGGLFSGVVSFTASITGGNGTVDGPSYLVDNDGKGHYFYSTSGISTLIGAFAKNGLIIIGGKTSSFPGLKRSGTQIQVRLADDSADASLSASNFVANALSAMPVTSGAGNSVTIAAGAGVGTGAGGSLILQAGLQATSGGDGKVIVKQVAGQTGNLFEIQNSSGVNKVHITNSGELAIQTTGGGYAPRTFNIATSNNNYITMGASNSTMQWVWAAFAPHLWYVNNGEMAFSGAHYASGNKVMLGPDTYFCREGGAVGSGDSSYVRTNFYSIPNASGVITERRATWEAYIFAASDNAIDTPYSTNWDFVAADFTFYTNYGWNRGRYKSFSIGRQGEIGSWCVSRDRKALQVNGGGMLSQNVIKKEVINNVAIISMTGGYTRFALGDSILVSLSPPDPVFDGLRTIEHLYTPSSNSSNSVIHYTVSNPNIVAVACVGTVTSPVAVSVVDIVSGDIAAKVLTVRSFSGQTANLQEWQNSAGTALASVDAAGKVISNALAAIPVTSGAGNSLTIAAGNGVGAFKGGDILLQPGAQGSSGGDGVVRVGSTTTNSQLLCQSGTNTSGGTYIFDVKSSAGTRIFGVDTARSAIYCNAPIFFTAGGGSYPYLGINSQGSGVWVGSMTSPSGTSNGYSFQFYFAAAITKTAGEFTSFICGGETFAPTSGNATFTSFWLGTTTINQTGTASGLIRGLYVDQTLTSVLGSYRAIETKFGGNLFNCGNPAYKGLTIAGAASQTANLQEWQNSAGTALASVDAAGNFSVAAITSGTWNGTAITVAKGGTNLTALGTANQVLAVNSAGTALAYTTLASGGTVTSVALSGGTTGFTVTGSPITTSGTITLAGTLAVANGGTGTTTAQLAINALAGGVTSAQYLRGNGTNVVLSAIQVADVPTLNQNTTGSAATVTTNANLTGGVTSVGNAATVITNANLTGGVTSVGNAATVVTNANLTGNVTSVGNATTLASIPAISGANLTSLTAANISAGTAGISVTGNAATVTTNANLTGHVTSVGNAAVLGSFTSAQLAGALSDETGTGAAVFATSPTLVTPLSNSLSAVPVASGPGNSLTIAAGSGVGTTGTNNGANLVLNPGEFATSGTRGSVLIDGLTVGKGKAGTFNTAVGVRALDSINAGSDNTAAGYEALRFNTGGQNTAIGVYALYSNTSSSGNVAIGHQALFSNTTGAANVTIGNSALSSSNGSCNTAIGHAVLLLSTSGSENAAIGYNSLRYNTTGSGNTASGSHALHLNTTGINNTASGRYAGLNLTTGSDNTFLGYSAGYNASQLVSATNSMALGNGAFTTASNQVVIGNTSVTQIILNGTATTNAIAAIPVASGAGNSLTIAAGSGVTSGAGANLILNPGEQATTGGRGTVLIDGLNVGKGKTGTTNTVFGVGALGAITTGTLNTAIGYQCLLANTTGTYNTAIGYQCLLVNTTGAANTALGTASLYKNTTGEGNTAIGHGVLIENTTGYQNTALGRQSLNFNTTGSQNIAIGAFSLQANATGNNNTASGYNALYYNTTGNNNTASGYRTLYSNTTGNDNTASGYESLYHNSTGLQNTASGYRALHRNTTGNNNTASGYESLYFNTTGEINTASGYGSLYFNTTGNHNTASGYVSLYYNTTGNYNTASGHAAGASITTGSNNTFLGSDAGYNASQLVSASNSMALGNGAFTTASNQVVIGNTSVTQIILNGTATTNAIAAIPVASGAGNSLTIAAGSGVTSGAGGSLILQAGLQATTGGDGKVIVRQVSGQTSNLQEWQNSAGTVLGVVTTAGRLGIGTASPNGKVDINLQAGEAFLFNSPADYSNFDNNFGYYVLGNGQTTFGFISGGAKIMWGQGSASLQGTWNFPSGGAFPSPVLASDGYGGGDVRWAITKTGNGASQTIYALTQVYADNGAGPKLVIGANGIDFALRDNSFWNEGIDSVAMSIAPSSGNIGIGTVSPNAKTHIVTAAATKGLIVQGAASQTANLQEWQNSAGTVLASVSAAGSLEIYSATTADLLTLTVGANANAGILFRGGGASASLAAIRAIDVSGYNGDLAFYTDNDGASTSSLTERMRILSAGNVGIGTTSPSARTHIVTAAATKGLIVQGAASQTANLQEWQNSAGTVLASVSAAGNFSVGTITSGTWNGTAITVAKGGTNLTALGTANQVLAVNSAGTALAYVAPTSGTVTSVSGAGTVSGLTLTGTVTSTGSLTLGGTLSAVTSLNSLTGGLSIVAGNNTTVTASGANITIGDSGYTIVNITATTYTFVLSDVQKLIIFDPSANGTYTIPPVSSVNFPVGSAIDVIRYSGPTVTFAAGSGVTLNGPNYKTLRTTYSGATLIHTSTDVWVLVGDVV